MAADRGLHMSDGELGFPPVYGTPLAIGFVLVTAIIFALLLVKAAHSPMRPKGWSS